MAWNWKRLVEVPAYRWGLEVAIVAIVDLILARTTTEIDLPTLTVAISSAIAVFESHNGLLHAFRSGLKTLDTRISQIEQRIGHIDHHYRLLSPVVVKGAQDSGLVSLRYYDRLFEDNMRTVIGITDGHFEFTVDAPEQAWESHIYNLERSPPESSFLATCLVPKTLDGVQSVFANPIYRRYCQTSYRLLRGRHLSHLKKVFVIDTLELALNSSEFMSHLVEIRDLEHEVTRDRLMAKIIVTSDLRMKRPNQKIIRDFMIWGEDIVVVSDMEASNLLTGLSVYSRKEDVLEKKGEFDRLLAAASFIDERFPDLSQPARTPAISG